MADQDELFYLQPGFDLGSLTVPRLRNILVTHNVNYPSAAKKPELIATVQSEVLPRAKRLLRDRDRVRRTSKGITDVPSSQESTIDGDDDDRELMPPPPPKTPRSRKSKSNLGDTATPSTSRRSKTPTTRKPGSKARQTDTDTEPDRPVTSSSRKTRKSSPGSLSAPVASAVKIEEPARIKTESSPFSDDNPFQQGSSPPSGSRRISSTSRSRKSGGRPSSSHGRKRETIAPVIKREDEGRATYEIPVDQLPADSVPTTEEFTPDETRELEQDPDAQLVRRRRSQQLLRRRKTKPAGNATKAILPTALVTVLGGIAAWYRQEKINIGYCGVGNTSWSLSSNPNIPAWVHENLQPQCEPCPSHAICHPNMEVQCDSDFILRPDPLSLNGLVPLPPSCEPDSEKARKIKAVADKAIEELRQRRASYECGESVSPTTDETTAITPTGSKLEISEQALKAEVSKMRRKGMTFDEFEALWRGAIGDIKAREEIEIVQDESGNILFSSNSHARFPIQCALRKWTWRTLVAHRIPFALLGSLAGAVLYVRHLLIARQKATAQIPELVATTLDRLATQAALKEDERTQEAFIPVGQLRDDILRRVFSASERKRVWEGVQKIVEGNSNVRVAEREGGKTGEWSRVWEWIGPVDLAPGFQGRRSAFIRGVEEKERESQVQGPLQGETREWNEGSAYY